MLNSGQVFSYLSLHVHNLLSQFVICVLPDFIKQACIKTKKGTYMGQYLCKHVGIWVNSSQA